MKKILMLLVTFAMVSGCSDSQSDECKDKETKCASDGKIQTCVDGSWGEAVACPNNGTCSANDNKCSGGAVEPGESCTTEKATRCMKGLVETCTGGKWSEGAACPENQVCSLTENKCVSTESKACTGEETRCNNGLLETCSGGTWGSAVACPQDQECSTTENKCVPKTAAPACNGSETRCVNGLLETCSGGNWGAGAACPANEECSTTENKCVPKAVDPACTDNATRCENGLLETCSAGTWGAGVSCGDGKVCKTDKCEDARKCGPISCTGNQVCMNNSCFDRDHKATEKGKECTSDYLESCDGDKLVWCSINSGAKKGTIEVSECDSNEVCALMANQNVGMCAVKDDQCNSTTAGNFNMCFDVIADGESTVYSSYLEVRECALATDNQYYPFRTDNSREIDCKYVGCVDKYTCVTENSKEKCADNRTTDYCDGNVLVYCNQDGNVVNKMNCEDYESTCLTLTDDPEGATADCDWSVYN